jgi:cytochrome P450
VDGLLADHERFSSRRVFIGMEGAPRAVPLEQDPPEHGPLRMLLLPAFSPRSVKRWADEAQRRFAPAMPQSVRAPAKG